MHSQPLQLHYTQPLGSPTSAAASALLSRSSSSDSLQAAPHQQLWPGSPADRAVPRDSPPGHIATNARLALADARATPPPRAALALGDQAHGHENVDAADAAASDIARLEALAANAGNEPSVGESKANGKAKAAKPKAKSKAAKPKAKTKPAKPEAKAVKPTAKAVKPKAKAAKPTANLPLGCGKCRRSKKGCKQCRDPAFGGERGNG